MLKNYRIIIGQGIYKEAVIEVVSRKEIWPNWWSVATVYFSNKSTLVTNNSAAPARILTICICSQNS